MKKSRPKTRERTNFRTKKGPNSGRVIFRPRKTAKKFQKKIFLGVRREVPENARKSLKIHILGLYFRAVLDFFGHVQTFDFYARKSLKIQFLGALFSGMFRLLAFLPEKV